VGVPGSARTFLFISFFTFYSFVVNKLVLRTLHGQLSDLRTLYSYVTMETYKTKNERHVFKHSQWQILILAIYELLVYILYSSGSDYRIDDRG
jgi:hypothetical protein